MHFELVLTQTRTKDTLTPCGYKLVHGKTERVYANRSTKKALQFCRFVDVERVFEPINNLFAQLSEDTQARIFEIYDDYWKYFRGEILASPQDKTRKIMQLIFELSRVVTWEMVSAWGEWYQNFYSPSLDATRSFFTKEEVKVLHLVATYYKLVLPFQACTYDLQDNKWSPNWEYQLFSQFLRSTEIDTKAVTMVNGEMCSIYDRLMLFTSTACNIAPMPSVMCFCGVDDDTYIAQIIACAFGSNIFEDFVESKRYTSRSTEKDNDIQSVLKASISKMGGSKDSTTHRPNNGKILNYYHELNAGDVLELRSPKEVVADGEDNTSRSEQLQCRDKIPASYRIMADSCVCNYGDNNRDKVLMLAEHVCGTEIDKELLEEFLEFAISRDWRFNNGQSYLLCAACDEYIEREDLSLLKMRGESNVIGVTAYWLHTLGFTDLVKWLFSEVDREIVDYNSVTLDVRRIKDWTISDETLDHLRKHYTCSDTFEMILGWADVTTTKDLTEKIRTVYGPQDIDPVYEYGERLVVNEDFKEQLLRYTCIVQDRKYK